MKELLYIEVPTPDTAAVCRWLQQEWQPDWGAKFLTAEGVRWRGTPQKTSEDTSSELSFFSWSVQRLSLIHL